jgi:hypothetical protein
MESIEELLKTRVSYYYWKRDIQACLQHEYPRITWDVEYDTILNRPDQYDYYDFKNAKKQEIIRGA